MRIHALRGINISLYVSRSRKAVSENIKREMSHGKPQKQAVAIALKAAGKSKYQKGAKAKSKSKSRAKGRKKTRAR